jgi:hypothetical protein
MTHHYACPECGLPLREEVTGTAGDNVPAEIEYLCSIHGLQAFWAYGHFDPAYPVLKIFVEDSMSSTFEQKKEKFKERCDRMELLFQWIKQDELSLKQFEELIGLDQKLHQEAIEQDSY